MPSNINVPVEFGGISIGDQTARLGLRINREHLDLATADEVFCGHRLTGKVVLGQRGDAPGQTKLFDCDVEVSGVFDVKRIGVNTMQIATGLTFSLEDVDVSELAKFSKGSGELHVSDIADLPDKDDDDDVDVTVRTDPPGTLKAEGPWRDEPLDELFDGGLRKSLRAAGLNTVGQLADYTATDKRLSDIPGIGPGKAAKIEDRMLQFWEDNPCED